jgi:chemotaxis protein CheD
VKYGRRWRKGSYHRDYTVVKMKGELACHGVGSCIVISIYDNERKIGGVVHALLPNQDEKVVKSAKYVDTAIEFLWKEMRRRGGKELEAKLAGGSDAFGGDTGKRNVKSAIEKLNELGIKVVAKDVGGERGRNCFFEVDSGKMRILYSIREDFSVKWMERII